MITHPIAFGFKRIILVMMKKMIMAIMLGLLIAPSAHSAKYAGEFLMGVGGRPLALGGAYVAEEGDILSGFYNPAGLTGLPRREAVFMHSETFGAELNHDYLSYASPLSMDSNGAAFAISLYRIGGGNIIITEQDSTGHFYEVGRESHAEYAGYFSFGKAILPRVSTGVTAKLIYRDIVDESAYGLGLDIGAIFAATDWMKLGVNIQDATTTLLSYSTGHKESIYPTAKIGSKLHASRGRFSAIVLTDADIKFEGRDYSAQFDIGGISFDSHLGLEISYFDKIAARIGSDIGNLTLGAGLNIRQFKIDLALRDHADLENSLLVSLNVRF